MTAYQLGAVLISLSTAIGGAALIYYGTAWLDSRERRKQHRSAAE